MKNDGKGEPVPQEATKAGLFRNTEGTDVTDKLIKLGLKKGYISVTDDRIEYLFCGKMYKFSDPEEKIRASAYVDLIENHEYDPERIDVEVYPPRRVPKLPADIVVFEDDKHEQVFMVVEVKDVAKRAKIDEAKREGLGNANLLMSKYLLLVCGLEKMAFDVQKRPSLRTLEKYTIADIPRRYGRIPKYKFKRGDPKWELQLVSFNELSNKFQLCHDEIWEGGKRDPAIAFDEMSKLMFAKIYDETFTPHGEYYNFQVGTYEKPVDVANRIKRELYQEAQDKEPEVFKSDIDLPPRVIFRIVEVLQDVWLTHMDLDVKGRAFENFLDKLFRGEYGQYFTRREIVEFMVSVLDPDDRDIVIDPACGSGGFLLYCLKLVRDKIRNRYRGDNRSINKLDWNFAHKQIFGIEINDRIARIAMMDMVIHDDGHSNIACHDGLDGYENFDKRKDIRPNKYTVLLTNPPFGAVIKDRRTLDRFELGSGRTRQRTEILFLERCLSLLAPGGRMGIVLPDGILTNMSLQYVRDFINKHAKILAVVSLPQTAFVPAGSGVKASLLFLQKKKKDEPVGNYPIFMAMAYHVGYDATGRQDENDLPNILKDYRKFLKEELK